MVKKVMSGGQDGADIAALRAAKNLGLETGGFMPMYWKTLSGPKPEYEEMYGMQECLVEGYPARTKVNVMWSQGTMRFATNWQSHGELATLRELKKYKKPYHDVDIHIAQVDLYYSLSQAMSWLQKHQISILNVSGNADKKIEPFVQEFLEAILL